MLPKHPVLLHPQQGLSRAASPGERRTRCCRHGDIGWLLHTYAAKSLRSPLIPVPASGGIGVRQERKHHHISSQGSGTSVVQISAAVTLPSHPAGWESNPSLLKKWHLVSSQNPPISLVIPGCPGHRLNSASGRISGSSCPGCSKTAPGFKQGGQPSSQDTAPAAGAAMGTGLPKISGYLPFTARPRNHV